MNNVIIDLRQIRNNAFNLRNMINSLIMAVVKGDAYGHGIEKVCQTLGPYVDQFATVTIEEGILVRKSGIEKPVLILNPEISSEAMEWGLTLTLSSLDQAIRINHLYGNQTVHVHVKIDTGLGRFGFRDNMIEQIAQVNDMINIKIDGVYTHLSSFQSVGKQLFLFKKIIRRLEERQIHIPLKHMANSMGALYYPETHLDMVRLGAVLYGLSPGGLNSTDDLMRFGLESALSWKSQIIEIKTFEEGAQIGYGGMFKTTGQTKVAYIPIGFANGYPPSAKHVMIGNTLVPVIGVAMNVTFLDVTEVSAYVGDIVTLFGREVRISEVASECGMKDSQLACQVGRMNTRQYWEH